MYIHVINLPLLGGARKNKWQGKSKLGWVKNSIPKTNIIKIKTRLNSPKQ
jgi:hypothetical protein